MKFQRSILFFFIVATLIITRFIVHSYDIHKHNMEISNWVNQSNEVIKNIELLYGTTSEIESGYRGYVITGEKSFAISCNDAALLANKELGIIKDLTKDNPPQQKNAAALSELVNQKIFYSGTVIRLRDSSAKAAMQLISAGRGKQLMTEIQAVMNTMLREENRLLTARLAESDSAEKHSFNFALFGGLCSLAFLMFFLYRLNRGIQLRKQAESELKSSEIKYRRLIEDAGAVMFTTDLNGHFTFISNRVLSLTGHRKEELLGLPYSVLVAPEWVEKVGSHYRAQFKQNTPETLLEFPIITKDKTQKWVEQTGVILYGEDSSIKGLQCIVKDIDERKHIQQELEASEYERKENQYRLESILNNSTSLIFIKDLEGRYLLINKRFESVSNISNEQVSGKTDYDFNPREMADKYSAADKWVLDNKKPREEEEIIAHADGAHHYMIIKFPLFDNKNEIYGLCGIATDITTRILHEQELVAAKKIAEEAEKSQERFLANMSHEIRTPLNGITGMTRLLAGTNLDNDQQEFADGITESVDTLLVLVNDILDFSKIKAGKLTIEEINFNLAGEINKTVYTLKHRASEKGLLFLTSIDPAIPDLLRGDPHRLSQILINLLGNAIKFTDKGEIKLFSRLQKTEEGKIWISFSIEDTGIGIPEDKLETIFESFSQSSSDISRRYGGTGLGLTITKQLIELQNGSIEVTSTPDKGSKFLFSIPYAYPSEGDKKITKTMIPSGDYVLPDTLKTIRLLVAEDNLINQKVIRFTLQKAGIAADIVNNGRELIDTLSSGKKYDLILSDIMMPEMDGYQAAAFIRRELKSDIPILGMTATILREEAGSHEEGINDYISKPFSISELIEKILHYVTPPPVSDVSRIEPVPANRSIPPYDLSTLREIDNKDYMNEVLDIFLTSTPDLLQELKANIYSQRWEAACQTAHRLKSSVGLFKMQELLEIITRIETNARDKAQLDEMPGLFEKGMTLYNKIHPLLEEEKSKL